MLMVKISLCQSEQMAIYSSVTSDPFGPLPRRYLPPLMFNDSIFVNSWNMAAASDEGLMRA